MAKIKNLKKMEMEIADAVEILDIDINVDVEKVTEEIATAFNRITSGPFPTVGKDGKLLQEALLDKFYNKGNL